MMRTIYFDMDGTIANLYEVENWLPKLIDSDPTPYEEAKPMIDMKDLSGLLKDLQHMGIRIGIVSCLAKNSTKEYDKAVRTAKRRWLKENIDITFDEIHIVKYGTRKDYIVKDKNGILFDDELNNTNNWRGMEIDKTEKDIKEVLRKILIRRK